MITRIEIDGFKSFENFALDVPPFLVLIGTNASGKSNLLDALSFLSAAVTRGMESAVALTRGDARGLFRQTGDGGVVDRMRFSVRFHQSARYEVVFAWGLQDDGLEGIVVESERVEGSDHGGRWADIEMDFTMFGPREPKTRFAFARMIWRELRNITILHLEAGALRLPSQVGGGSLLEQSGRNLPNFLRRLAIESGVKFPRGAGLQEISMRLVGLVREVTGFDVVVDEARRDVRIEFSSQYHARIGAELASDGTLRMLAVLAALHDTGLVAIEEPENGVFPDRLRQLLGIAQELDGDRQVIFTSHSPVVLDVVPPRNIAYFDMTTIIENGVPSRVTRVRRLRDEGGPAAVENERWARVTDSELDRFRAGIEEPVG
ncbi:AAA family ATPase [Herbidospora cretacea]|uniref:AAA family ATPase n=1 Tax=Herbidospora cretacea TaxID=28444 RepID=UPI000774B510|nr:ATP-binding protein [Herbidospora cretacea]